MASPEPCDTEGRSVDQALAVVIGNTGRGRRSVDLVTLAEHVIVLREHFGSFETVGLTVGLSAEMVRQFASVMKLDRTVLDLLRSRVIDSVDVAHRLTKFAPSDQSAIAGQVAAGRLDSADVRALVTLRQELPAVDTADLIEHLLSTRNIREYVIELPVSTLKGDLESIGTRLGELVGDDGVLRVAASGPILKAVLNEQGMQRLRTIAQLEGVSVRVAVERTLKGDRP